MRLRFCKMTLCITTRCMAASIGMLALTGCQGTPMAGIGAWNQPTRVPPPATGSFQVPGTYSGATGSGTTGVAPPDPVKSVGFAAPPSGQTGASNPMLDNITAAQNQLKQATDNARAAVYQTSNQIQGQVNTASAQMDRLGAGVVQASQVLSDSLQDPIPPIVPSATGASSVGAPPRSYALEGSGMPSSPPATSTSGSIGDSAPTTTVVDPNAQWRKPTPR
jgi:hypothetical protein